MVDKDQSPKTKKDPIGNFFSQNVHYTKKKDDLLDIHIGNPLRKITQLLEEIKKQKAFSFTLKGSLGIAGVALAIGIFGVFGGGKMLCEKGVQSHIGIVRVLQIEESNSLEIPVLSRFLNYFYPQDIHKRVVLIKNDTTAITIPYTPLIDFNDVAAYTVVATGEYDTCSQTLHLKDKKGIEIYN